MSCVPERIAPPPVPPAVRARYVHSSIHPFLVVSMLTFLPSQSHDLNTRIAPRSHNDRNSGYSADPPRDNSGGQTSTGSAAESSSTWHNSHNDRNGGEQTTDTPAAEDAQTVSDNGLMWICCQAKKRSHYGGPWLKATTASCLHCQHQVDSCCIQYYPPHSAN